jgi:sulfite reductase (NADPH) flavoprotein alpha-component
MLLEPKLKILHDLVKTSTKDEMVWMHGYLSGILSTGHEQTAPVTAKPNTQKITIAYGTETGNSKKLAIDFAAKAKKNNINAKLVSLDQYRLNDLSKEEYFFPIISTHGEGEPPAAAKKFFEHIHRENLQLGQLKYGVLALGDNAYPLFCKAGEDVDSRLENLGGQRIVEIEKCDTDYETDAEEWFARVLEKINSPAAEPHIVPAVPARKTTGRKIYTGKILSNINLNDKGSKKETHHIEIATDEIDYLPGDSIGVIPENRLSCVELIFELTGISREKVLVYRNQSLSVFELLKKKLNIGQLPERVVKKYANIVRQDIPETKLNLIDLLKIYPVRDARQFEEVINILEPVTPRLYSVSSSPQAHSGEVHLTVARDRFFVNEEEKYGLCSDLLTQMAENSSLEFYVQKNNQFRLPGDDKDVIMIGPGTGIAPFRSFIAERDAVGASGRNWLFFGDQHFTTDFLYQTEILNWVNTGVLNKVHVAFSRDQEQKIYVQHKMLKHGAELFNWIDSGAHLYICGAMNPMSEDVEKTILQIVEQYGNKTKEEAQEYLNGLKEQGRYAKDVY